MTAKDRMPTAVLEGVKFVLCLLFVSSVTASAENRPLRVFCWNLHHGVGGDGKLDLDRIAKVIKREDPDLVALQEVDNRCGRSGKVDQTAELARLTALHGVFGKAMDFDGGEYGQAVLSRWPVQTSKVHKLPGTGEPRIAFEVMLQIDGVETGFVSVHLGLDDASRLSQAEELGRIFGAGKPPLILCGDFNDRPDSEPLRKLSQWFSPVAKKAPVFTHPADKPAVEIDHFLVRTFKPESPIRVLPEAIASDHRPLLAAFLGD